MPTPVILRDFSLTRDFRLVRWQDTLKYNLLRATCAGVVLGTLMFLFPQEPGMRGAALLAPIAWPITYLFFLVPLGMALALFRHVPFVGLFALFISLFAVAVGDPLVSILHRKYPSLVPVDSPPIFSATLIFWVLEAHEISVAS